MSFPRVRWPWPRTLLSFPPVMLLLAALLALMPLLASAASQEEVQIQTDKSIWCWQCGTTKECPLPWDDSKVGKVNCSTTTCMKFDGWASDGKRVMMRDCGFFTAEECRDEESITGVETKGRLCHCSGEYCNTAWTNAGVGTLCFLLVAAAVAGAT